MHTKHIQKQKQQKIFTTEKRYNWKIYKRQYMKEMQKGDIIK